MKRFLPTWSCNRLQPRHCKGSCPLLDLPDPSKAQSIVGTVLSTYTSHVSRGQDALPLNIKHGKGRTRQLIHVQG
jgi:hypothetical protein